MVTFLVNNAALVFFNYLNASIDSKRIKQHKRIYHGLNFMLYALFVAGLIFLFRMNIGNGILFGVAAFFNRQLSFDIILNLKRGRMWDYVSFEKPPKSIMDRIEIRLFGYNGYVPNVVYAAGWITCFILSVLW